MLILRISTTTTIWTRLHRHRWLCILLLLLLAVSIPHLWLLPVFWLPSKPTEIHLRRWLSCLIEIVIAGYGRGGVDGLEAPIGRQVVLILGLAGHYLGRLRLWLLKWSSLLLSLLRR